MKLPDINTDVLATIIFHGQKLQIIAQWDGIFWWESTLSDRWSLSYKVIGWTPLPVNDAYLVE